jgi:hypothetical protein
MLTPVPEPVGVMPSLGSSSGMLLDESSVDSFLESELLDPPSPFFDEQANDPEPTNASAAAKPKLRDLPLNLFLIFKLLSAAVRRGRIAFGARVASADRCRTGIAVVRCGVA